MPKDSGKDNSRRGLKPYHHGDLKETLLAAALELVDTKGPKGFSLAEVCRLAGVSVAAPYRHFEDKECLLAAVAQSSFAAFGEELSDARNAHNGHPGEALKALGKAYITFAQRNPSRFRVMFSSELRRSRFPELYATIHNVFLLVLETIEEYRQIPHGPADPTNENYQLAVSLWSQCHGIAALTVDGFLREISMENKTHELLSITIAKFLQSLD